MPVFAGIALDALLLSSSIWTKGANLPSARGDAASLLTCTGIYVFGGASGGTATRSVIKLDPGNNFTATAQSNMSQGLERHHVQQFRPGVYCHQQ